MISPTYIGVDSPFFNRTANIFVSIHPQKIRMARSCTDLHLGRAALLLGVLLCLLSGCASFQPMETAPLPDHLPVRHELTAVPFFPQEEYQCGPAALAMAISWSGLAISPEDLVEEVYTPSRKGSLQSALIAAARRHGRLAYEISSRESFFHEIAAGHPVLILQNLSVSWLPVWHYSVLIGYDAAREHVILRSGTASRKVMPFDVFENTWARSDYWGVVILQPTPLPALAKEKTYFLVFLIKIQDPCQSALGFILPANSANTTGVHLAGRCRLFLQGTFIFPLQK